MAGPGKRGPRKGWVPGQSGNPLGGKLSPYRDLTTREVAATLGRVWNATAQEINALIEDPAIPLSTKAAGRAVLRAYSDGDWSGIEGILTRIIGRPKETVEMVSNELKQITTGELMGRAAAILEALKAEGAVPVPSKIIEVGGESNGSADQN